MSLYIDKKERSEDDIQIATCKDGNVYFTYEETGDKSISNSGIYPTVITEKNQIYSAYISGLSGSRKTTFAVSLIKQLMENKNNKIDNIFLVSQTPMALSDPAYKDLVKMKRKITVYDQAKKKEVEKTEPVMVQLDISEPRLYAQDISIFKNSIFLFDDIDGVTGDIKKLLASFHTSILTTGRKMNIHPITIFHKSRNYSQTAMTLTESQHKIIFPKVNRQNSMSFLEDYMKFKKDIIEKIYNSVDLKDNRWLYIRDTVPSFIMTANYIELI